jgi:hypothetical protein
MAFGDCRVLDRLYRADSQREGLQLDPAEVADLVEEWPDDEQVITYDEVVRRLHKVDVKAFRISVKAQRELASMFGYEAEDIWP